MKLLKASNIKNIYLIKIDLSDLSNQNILLKKYYNNIIIIITAEFVTITVTKRNSYSKRVMIMMMLLVISLLLNLDYSLPIGEWYTVSNLESRALSKVSARLFTIYRYILLIAVNMKKRKIYMPVAVHLPVRRKCAVLPLCHAALTAEQISDAEHHYVRAKSEQRKAGETTYRYSFPNARIVCRVTQLRILCSGMQTVPSRSLSLSLSLSVNPSRLLRISFLVTASRGSRVSLNHAAVRIHP